MTYVCSQCHQELTAAEGESPERCTNCGAEAGLEKVKAVPVAMKVFGLVVIGSLVAAASGDVISRLAG